MYICKYTCTYIFCIYYISYMYYVLYILHILYAYCTLQHRRERRSIHSWQSSQQRQATAELAVSYCDCDSVASHHDTTKEAWRMLESLCCKVPCGTTNTHFRVTCHMRRYSCGPGSAGPSQTHTPQQGKQRCCSLGAAPNMRQRDKGTAASCPGGSGTRTSVRETIGQLPDLFSL